MWSISGPLEPQQAHSMLQISLRVASERLGLFNSILPTRGAGGSGVGPLPRTRLPLSQHGTGSKESVRLCVLIFKRFLWPAAPQRLPGCWPQRSLPKCCSRPGLLAGLAGITAPADATESLCPMVRPRAGAPVLWNALAFIATVASRIQLVAVHGHGIIVWQAIPPSTGRRRPSPLSQAVGIGSFAFSRLSISIMAAW
jgi:hypothetical protein